MANASDLGLSGPQGSVVTVAGPSGALGLSTVTGSGGVAVKVGAGYIDVDGSAIVAGTIALTTTGSSGAATLVGNTLNIPQYSGGGSGSGTVTTLVINAANGFSADVLDPTTTPTITLHTTATGILKGDGNAIMPAGAGSDYQAAIAGSARQPVGIAADGTTVAGTSTPIIPTVTATYASTTNFDLSQSNNQQVTLTGNPTLTVSNAAVGQRFTINLIQDGTGSRTVTWFSGITWASGSAPTLKTGSNAIDTLSFWCVSSGVYQGYTTSVPVPGASGQMIYNNGTALAGAANAKIDGNSLFNVGSPVSDPGTQVQGSLYPSSAGGLTYSPGPAMAERIRGRIFSCGSCAAVSNSSSYTSIFGSPTGAAGSLTIKGGTLTAGDLLEYKILGVWQSVNQPVTINHAVKLGSTTITQGASAPSITYNQSSNGLIYAQFNGLLVTASGSSGGVAGMTSLALIGSAGGTINTQAYSGIATESGTPIAIDTTVDQLFDIQVIWGTAATGNIFQVTGFSLWIR